MRTDNEENATLAMKICIDLHRSFREALVGCVDNFLGIVKDMYANMEGVVERIFSDEGPTDDGRSPGTAAGQPATTPALGQAPPEKASSNIELPLGMHSFKLLQECPIAIVFLFQSYRDVVAREIQVFVPLIFEVCSSCFCMEGDRDHPHSSWSCSPEHKLKLVSRRRRLVSSSLGWQQA